MKEGGKKINYVRCSCLFFFSHVGGGREKKKEGGGKKKKKRKRKKRVGKRNQATSLLSAFREKEKKLKRRVKTEVCGHWRPV